MLATAPWRHLGRSLRLPSGPLKRLAALVRRGEPKAAGRRTSGRRRERPGAGARREAALPWALSNSVVGERPACFHRGEWSWIRLAGERRGGEPHPGPHYRYTREHHRGWAGRGARFDRASMVVARRRQRAAARGRGGRRRGLVG